MPTPAAWPAHHSQASVWQFLHPSLPPSLLPPALHALSPSHSHSHGILGLGPTLPFYPAPPALHLRPTYARMLTIIYTHAHARSRPPPAAARPRSHCPYIGSMTGSSRCAIAPTPQSGCAPPSGERYAMHLDPWLPHAAARPRSRAAPPPAVHSRLCLHSLLPTYDAARHWHRRLSPVFTSADTSEYSVMRLKSEMLRRRRIHAHMPCTDWDRLTPSVRPSLRRQIFEALLQICLLL
ncbi:hypothetical protein B0H13DRAFT_2427457 [Mycena leptocephala]|nr:hypothetical protein B0H13DRAFT_2427457 [Mycena leptocephala]